MCVCDLFCHALVCLHRPPACSCNTHARTHTRARARTHTHSHTCMWHIQNNSPSFFSLFPHSSLTLPDGLCSLTTRGWAAPTQYARLYQHIHTYTHDACVHTHLGCRLGAPHASKQALQLEDTGVRVGGLDGALVHKGLCAYVRRGDVRKSEVPGKAGFEKMAGGGACGRGRLCVCAHTLVCVGRGGGVLPGTIFSLNAGPPACCPPPPPLPTHTYNHTRTNL